MKTIGTKIVNGEFFTIVKQAVSDFDWTSCRQKGQAYIELPRETCEYVSAGVGRRTDYPDDYVIRVHRDKVGLFLKRHLATKVDKVAVVVYEKDAYLADPEVLPEEAERCKEYTHILVAVLASSGSKSPLTPYRFVSNLAGGNREALLWSADEIREKAKEIKDYADEWCIVAD